MNKTDVSTVSKCSLMKLNYLMLNSEQDNYGSKPKWKPESLTEKQVEYNNDYSIKFSIVYLYSVRIVPPCGVFSPAPLCSVPLPYTCYWSQVFALCLVGGCAFKSVLVCLIVWSLACQASCSCDPSYHP